MMGRRDTQADRTAEFEELYLKLDKRQQKLVAITIHLILIHPEYAKIGPAAVYEWLDGERKLSDAA